ncbi:hypothetical protein D039_2393A, partial [Vibrio parahaemolyticus EKP-028]
MQRIFL